MTDWVYMIDIQIPTEQIFVYALEYKESGSKDWIIAKKYFDKTKAEDEWNGLDDFDKIGASWRLAMYRTELVGEKPCK